MLLVTPLRDVQQVDHSIVMHVLSFEILTPLNVLTHALSPMCKGTGIAIIQVRKDLIVHPKVIFACVTMFKLVILLELISCVLLI